VLLSSVLLTVIGWSKSLPVSIGRPRLRIWTHGIQALVLLPLTALFGLWWQATGAAAALAVSSVVFAAMWGVIVVRLHREHRSTPSTTLPEAP
jgi:O-antigen/teichoic acid export membrane protein